MYLAGDVRQRAETILTSRSGASRRNGSTCVDFVEDCKKATSIHFLSRKKVESKQIKQNHV